MHCSTASAIRTFECDLGFLELVEELPLPVAGVLGRLPGVVDLSRRFDKVVARVPVGVEDLSRRTSRVENRLVVGVLDPSLLEELPVLSDCVLFGELERHLDRFAFAVLDRPEIRVCPLVGVVGRLLMDGVRERWE